MPSVIEPNISVVDPASGNALAINAAGQVGVTGNLGFIPTGTPLAVSAAAAAAAANAVSLPAAVGKTTYITGFQITTGNPAAAVTGVATITGLSNQLNYQVVESVTLGAEMIVEFPQPIPASAANQAITVTLPAIAGGAASAVVATGFQL